MKLLKLLCLSFVLMLTLGGALAITWSPQGNIDLKNRYNITNWSVGNCTSTNFVKGINSDGTWACANPAASSDTDSWWNITTSNYLVNYSNVLSLNETKLNNTIDARAASSGGNASWNQTFANTLYAAVTWNKSYADTLYAAVTWNKTYADTLYASIIYSYNQSTATYNMYNAVWATTANSSYALWTWNKTYADTLYAPIGYGADWNKTYADTLYASIIYSYNQSTATYNMYNAVWATTANSSYALWTWNKTYADTLYAPIGYGADWNKTYADTLYASIIYNYNQSTATYNMYNGVWTATYNTTYDAKANTGNCAAGTVVQNTTTSGVQCVTSTAGSSYAFQCTAGNFVYNLSADGSYLCDAPAGSGDITAVTGDTYITNGAPSGDVSLIFNETKMNATVDSRDADHIYTHLGNFTDNLDYSDKNVNRSSYWDNLDSPLGTWLSTANDSYALWTWNKTYADTLYAAVTWNKTYADTLYATIGYGADWNKTYADTLYAAITWGYNQSTATYNMYNAIWATTYNATYDAKVSDNVNWNKTYADTLYALVTWNKSYADTLYLSDIVEDTSPQLGGYLDANAQDLGSTSDEIENVYVGTTTRIYFGDGQEASIYFNGTNLIIAG